MILPQHGMMGGSEDLYDVIWLLGDSIGRGNSDAYGPTPDLNTVYQWDAGAGNLRTITNTDLLEPIAATGIPGGSQWPAFGIEYYKQTGRIPVFVNCAIGGSSFYDASAGFSWYTNDTLFSAASTKLANCLAYLGKTKPAFIMNTCGFNDINNNTLSGSSIIYMQSFFNRIVALYPGVKIYNTLPAWGTTFSITTGHVTRLFNLRDYYRTCENDYPEVYLITTLQNLSIWNNALYYKSDQIHLTYDGNLLIGTRQAKVITGFQGFVNKRTVYVSGNFWDEVSRARLTVLDQFFSDLVSNGWFTQIDSMKLMSGLNTGDVRNTTVDLFCMAQLVVTGATPSLGGLSFDGVDDYATGAAINLISKKAIPASDIVTGVLCLDNRTLSSVTAALFGVSDGTNIMRLIQNSATPREEFFGFQTVASGALNYSETAFADGFVYSVGRSSGNISAYKDGTVMATGAKTYAAFLTTVGSLAIGAFNNNATLGLFINADLGLQYSGKLSGLNMTNFTALLKSFYAAWAVTL